MTSQELDESFLPRIHAVFFSVFDARQGPKVAFQVPENLIVSRYDPKPAPTSSKSRSFPSPLVYFNDVSEYVIPKTQLCNRLVVCNTPKHKIAGFPVLLEDPKYPRNEFRFNLCFVFDRKADLSCYEPIVRKVGRVLTESEQDSSFLSSPQTAPRIYQILEQLFEDLNSYSETSIPITPHTTLDLKIFPFYPNPPAVRDWSVPVALVDIAGRLDSSSDITMVKVVSWIDGVRCVGRIAEEADVDLDWVRGCVEHLLYYQHIMLLDLFTHTNIYTLTPTFKYLALDPIVMSECPLYITPSSATPEPWHTLLRLYTRLKPGKTIAEWADECGVGERVHIDVRRFVTFGVIKGFLRRVERWPVFLGDEGDKTPNARRSPTPTPSKRLPDPAAKPATKSNLTRQLLAKPTYVPPPMPRMRSPSPTSSLLSEPHSPSPPPSPPPPPHDPPPELVDLLDGAHCGDEICWTCGVTWEDMERWLAVLGGEEEVYLKDTQGEGAKRKGVRGDFGRVRVVFR